MSEAPRGPDASSFDGSTVRPKPAAAEYIETAATSKAKAATANPIATRPDTRLMLFCAFPRGRESVGLEFRLRNVGRSPALRGTRRVFGLFVGGEEQYHDGAVGVLQDLPGRLEAVDPRKIDIHQHQVGMQCLARLDRGFARFGFGDHLEAVRSLDHGPRRLPERRLVVHNQYPNCHVCGYRMADSRQGSNGASTT